MRGRLAGLTSPTAVRNANLLLCLLWIILIVPTVLFWTDSVPWIVFMSLWANIASHFAGWTAGRTEVKQEQQMNGVVSECKREHTNEGDTTPP